jgi:hypothetical protein
VESENRPDNEILYDQSFEIYVNDMLYSAYIVGDKFDRAASRLDAGISSRKSEALKIEAIQHRSAYIMSDSELCEEEDEMSYSGPKLQTRYEGHCIEHIEDGPEGDVAYTSGTPSKMANFGSSPPPTVPSSTKESHPSPRKSRPIFKKVIPRLKIKRGAQSEGTSVLSVRGDIGEWSRGSVDLRLDSGADISLLSYEFYESMEKKPSIKKGPAIELVQLVGSERVDGYVEVPIFMESRSGVVLEMVTEAHLVKNMTVPILLGEDFQVKYELAVFRNAESGTPVSVPRAAEDVDAQGVDRNYCLPRFKTSVSKEPSFVRAKTSQRVHAQRRKQAQHEDEGPFGSVDVGRCQGQVWLPWFPSQSGAERVADRVGLVWPSLVTQPGTCLLNGASSSIFVFLDPSCTSPSS